MHGSGSFRGRARLAGISKHESWSPDAFLIVAVEQPEATSQADRKAPVPVTLTLKGEHQSYEFAIDLDTSPSD